MSAPEPADPAPTPVGARTPIVDTDGTVSVVMPCFDEERTIVEITAKVLASPLVGELVIVDDASRDATGELIAAIAAEHERVRTVRHDRNRGKGAALRTGLALATRPFVIVQDADLEYDPSDYPALVEPLADGRADVVYGSRFAGSAAHRVLYFWHSVGNRVLTTLSNMTTNLNLTDMETCYKAFRLDVVRRLDLEEPRFGVEPEITAKVARLGVVVYEVGIGYDGRTYADGKKIGWRDGVHALFCIAAYSATGERLRLKRWSPALARALHRRS